jgi:hypothetical protein
MNGNYLKELLDNAELYYDTNFDFNDITDIIIEKKHINKSSKQTYQHFFIYKNEKTLFTRTRFNKNLFLIDLKCRDCHRVFRKKTNLGRYIYTTYFAIPTLNIESVAHRCISCKNKLNSINGKEKARQTSLQRFGVSHNSKKPGFAEKVKNTCAEKYGPNYKELFCKKAQETYFKKTSYYFNTQNPVIRAKQVKKWKETWLKKSYQEKQILTKKRLEGYYKLGSPGLFGINNSSPYKSKSRISEKWLNELKMYFNEQNIPLNILDEQGVPPYTVDFLIPGICFIEFYGSFWHADPYIYDEDDVLRLPFRDRQTIAKQVWQRDELRCAFITEKLQIPGIIVWENDYKKNPQKTFMDFYEAYTTILNDESKQRIYFCGR